jgi:TetR/AcrR family transcriptional regulator
MTPSTVATRSRAGRRRDAARTRDALIAAGTGLFAELGYDGVPVAAIAARARVNKAMINYHFGGKRKLYLAIVSATFSEIVSRVEALASSPRPAPDLLRDLIAVVGDTAARRSPHFCTMMLREVLSGGKHLEPAVLAQPARVLAAVQRIVERGVREGTLRPVDPMLTHLSIVGSLVFFFATTGFRERVFSSSRALRLEPPAPDAYVRHLQELIAHGLATGAAASRPAPEPRRSRLEPSEQPEQRRARVPRRALPGRA